MQLDMPDDASVIRNPIAELIERFTVPLFIFAGLLYLVAFNGKWRLGLDSANYRGLADSIATGRGYHFGDWAGENIYPGFPLLLAALQRLFGKSALAPCIVLLIMSVLTLIVTYRLIRLHYPKWIAVTVTFGLATNSWFLQQTSELMTDVPFLLGVMTALYGWDLLRSRINAKSISILLAGLLLAASMRPTFLVLVAAWAIACAVGFAFALAPSRKFYLICVAIMLGVWALAAALDPRVRGFHPLAGGYEREVLEMLPGEAISDRFDKLMHVLNKQLPSGFFGEQVSLGSIRIHGTRWTPTAIFLSVVLLLSTTLLARKHLLWALFTWLAILTTVIYSDEPRYYLMILPLLLLAWLRMLLNMRSILPKTWGNLLLAGGLALVTLNNLSSSVHFVREQRATNFLAVYKDGKVEPVVRLADLIREKTKPDDTVLAPGGSILSYLTGRHVFTQREVLPHRARVRDFPTHVRERHISYAVFPAKWYRDKEPAIAQMMERGVLRPGRIIGETDGMRLAQLRFNLPRGTMSWTQMPRLLGPAAFHRKLPTTRPTSRPIKRTHKIKRKPATHPTTAPTTRFK